MGINDFPRSVKLYSTFGGICGYNGTGYVTNCTSAVDISDSNLLTNYLYQNAGGICGQNNGTIEKCNSIKIITYQKILKKAVE